MIFNRCSFSAMKAEFHAYFSDEICFIAKRFLQQVSKLQETAFDIFVFPIENPS